MCGIIGYIGYRNASPILFNGLKRMEYRGYDSAGIACIHNGEIQLRKDIGKIEEINKQLHFNEIAGKIGIAHTRWATHGKINRDNAHPHLSCLDEVVIVHNGIIENHHELKKKLLEEGHKFRSETDTEVISHLIEKNYLIEKNEKKAILRTVNELRGSFAFLAVLSSNPKVIFGARKDVPLIVGVGEGETVLASDVLAFIDYTDRVVFLDNMVVIAASNNKLDMCRFNGEEIKREVVKVAWEIGNVSKKGYTHYTLKEIHEQPETIKTALYQDSNKLKLISDSMKEANRICITGSGTSFHAALVLKNLLAKYSRMHSEAVLSSEFGQYCELIDKGTLVIAISQSGETADVLEAVKKSKNRGAEIWSIVNAVGSSLVRESEESIYINCGPEIGVAASKSFTSQLAVAYLLSTYVSNEISEIDRDALSRSVADTIMLEGDVKRFATKYYEKDVYFVGRGIHHAIALEGALKLKELAYIHAEGMAAGELKHGTLALVNEGTPVVVLNPSDETYNDTLTNAAEMKARGAMVIGISDRPNETYDEYIQIPLIDKAFYPILEVIPLQMLAYYCALRKHGNPDLPRNLAKSVTVK